MHAIANTDSSVDAQLQQLPAEHISTRLLDELEKVIVGQRETLRLLLSTVLSGGHVLLEDRPGVGKTVLARSLGVILGLRLGRLQGTPDLLPTDVTGVHIFNPETRDWDFRAGPIFAPIVLFDELNRATAKAQSALLEAMAERQITVDGETMQLPRPFSVIATQNPHGDAGTHRLGSAQLDRFATQLTFGLPGRDAERAIVSGQAGTSQSRNLRPAVTQQDLPRLFGAVSAVAVKPQLVDYVLEMVDTFRGLDQEAWLSVRVTETLMRTAKGVAFMNGRDYLAPEDVQSAAPAVVRHRLPGGIDRAEILQAVLTPPVPVHGI